MRIRRGRRVEWNLSFASMSDIAFLLIIFFAVAGKFTRSTEKQVSLPVVQIGERTQYRDVEVVVTKEGHFFIKETRFEPDELAEELTQYITEDMSQEARTITVFVDRDTPYGYTKVAIEAVNQADANLELSVRQGN